MPIAKLFLTCVLFAPAAWCGFAEYACGDRCGWIENADHAVGLTGGKYDSAVFVVVVMRRAVLRRRMRRTVCGRSLCSLAM